jgi:ring-1,2-phenylacetyl-CoA epoxidase subunit PaaC
MSSSTAVGLEPSLRTALIRHIVTLADTKRILGIRYSDWLLGAPSIETGIAASSMAQDEWGHARLLYAMLKDLGVDPAAVERDRPKEQYASVDPLDRKLSDWAAVVAAMVGVDAALSVALESFASGGFEPARSRIPKMLMEETFHRDLGNAWFRRLASGSEEARRRLVDSLRAQLPRTLAWLEPEDDPFGELTRSGMVAPGAADRFWSQVGAVLEGAGITRDSVTPLTDGWDVARSRGPGHPDQESVERARGDRNRALLVE